MNKLSEEILQYSRLPNNYENDLPKKDFCELARDFIVYSGDGNVEARDNLETLLVDYLDEISPGLSSVNFEKLSALPFNFIIDTNFGNLFFDLLKKCKNPKKGFYNFKGDQVSLSNIGTEKEPLIYNLYGSIRQPKSLALTDYDLIQLLSNIISKSPALPADIRAVVANEETSILFLGFGMLAKNWYFRILLHALTAGNKKTMSYALEYLANINYDEDPAVLFFKDELKVCLYQLDQKTFVETLAEKYAAFKARQTESDSTDFTKAATGNNEIKAFVSYKREDFEKVKPIVERLEANSITVLWDNSTEFNGAWEKKIEEMINNSQAFILLQSENLKCYPVNYVNVEIRQAIKRARHYARLDGYLYPSFIDAPSSRLTDSDFDFINDINNWDLSAAANTDRIAKEIIRNQERNRKTTII